VREKAKKNLAFKERSPRRRPGKVLLYKKKRGGGGKTVGKSVIKKNSKQKGWKKRCRPNRKKKSQLRRGKKQKTWEHQYTGGLPDEKKERKTSAERNKGSHP